MGEDQKQPYFWHTADRFHPLSGKKYFSWLYKAAHIIDMAVGFIVVNTKKAAR